MTRYFTHREEPEACQHYHSDLSAIDEPPYMYDPDAAREYMEQRRWPDHVTACPHCATKGEAFRLTSRPASANPGRKGLWKCRACGKQFTVTVGSVFEGSRMPLPNWLRTIQMLCSTGTNAHQLHRDLGCTYKTASFILHRVRYAMTQKPLSSKISRRNKAATQQKQVSLAPLDLEQAVSELLKVQPEAKHRFEELDSAVQRHALRVRRARH